ncbi:proline--tRNA ligase [Candidatus Woesearchaeota archaeon]|nr:MAG: proline--tRNA ligase [Candidatus Woesearchaeota archaeon]
MAEDTKGITVKKADDMPEWYAQVCLKSEVADYAPVKGCMVIRPRGYALWQAIVDRFNEMLAEDGVQNAYFPMFIPESFFKREAEHAEGFAPEVAWIANKDGARERLAIRPTSETIMYDSYRRWIRSWRDLPLKINQWCNIVRWEVQDVKLFLRSREFLWQEGHCVYETAEERDKETLHYLERYRQIAEDLLAVPVLLGRKTESEKFAGADRTYTIESLMPDGKALQMGTSHDLSQGFAKAFGIEFQGRDEQPSLPFQNSWGISTRLLGALILTHGDDKGLVIPPRMAPNKVVVVPIIFEKHKAAVIAAAEKVGAELKAFNPIIDTRDEYTSGWKFNEYELKGVPLRIEVGPKDLEQERVVIVRRDTGEKEFVPRKELVKRVAALLEDMQEGLLAAARKRIADATVTVNDFAAFEKAIKEKKMVFTSHCGDADCEAKIKERTAATSRCIPLDEKRATPAKGATCVLCGEPATYALYFARSY